MYIRGPILRNSIELAVSVPIGYERLAGIAQKHCLYRAPDRPFLEVERTYQDGGPFNTGKVGVSLYPI